MATQNGGTTVSLNQLVTQYQKNANGEVLGRALDADGNPVGGNVVLEKTTAGDWIVRDTGAKAEPNLYDLINGTQSDNCVIEFDPDDGSFVSIGGEGNDSIVLNLRDMLSTIGADGSNFKDIEVDFSTCKNLNNSGTSTMNVLKGINGDGVGKKLGALTGLSVDSSGKIFGTYDNGNTVLLSQIAVAQFSNASGLEKVGNSCYQTTLNSGDFDGIGVEVSADGSAISTGELEMSNVDLSAQFTDMIITQRGFQANSRVITTSDTLLEELINLKR